MEKNLPYRPCVGMMLLNSKGKVFVAKRIDMTAEAWQMPQGGIDEGEDVKNAALRELKEEIGTDNVTIIDECENWLSYDLPDHLIGKVWKGRYRGQKMKWFVMRFIGDDNEINIETKHPEFSEWKWINMDNLADYIVPFKKEIYSTLVEKYSYLTS